MKKIVIVPLDERPCNYVFPQLLTKDTDYEIVLPDLSLMGQKKTPGDIEKLWKFVFEHASTASGMILSIDTLMYGGIVPSRLHSDNEDVLLERLSQLEEIRKLYPNLDLFAFNLIMRNPTYSSDDEEPTYYQHVGREIHLRGVYEHKEMLGILTEQEKQDYQVVLSKLDTPSWTDYTERRKRNKEVNKKVISYVQENIIDFLIIPQDDASPYGLTALDQKDIRVTIKNNQVMSRVMMYPGADEVMNTLLARMINQFEGVKPTVYLKYASEESKKLIPLYEDRPIHETIKYQVIAAGGIVIDSDIDADLILITNAPPSKQLNASQAYLKGIEYDAFRNQIEAVEYASYMIRNNKQVIFGDVAFGNGSDLDLIQLLVEKGMLFQLAGYAGWNTSSNTLGTCIPQGMIYNIYKETKAHLDFLALRYVEDAGYCATVRQDAITNVLPALNCNYFKADGQRGIVAKSVEKLLNEFVSTHLYDETYNIVITDCYMPWSRMFEVGVLAEVQKK